MKASVFYLLTTIILLSACSSSPGAIPVEAQLGDTWSRPIDGMVMVYVPAPAAPFTLPSRLEAPTESYWIDKYEVSNAQYQLCVDAGACERSQFADEDLLNGPDQPVVGVSWFDAADYAAWVGGKLPTQEEWEYAAAGEAGKVYPWGNEFDGTRFNFCDIGCPGDHRDIAWDDGYNFTAPVGSYPEGESWVGAANMAGNVSEWADSWYDRNQSMRVRHGGSWFTNRNPAHAAQFIGWPPESRPLDVGFRVVVPHSPSR